MRGSVLERRTGGKRPPNGRPYVRALFPVPVPFSASSAYTQRSLLHAYTTPPCATGDPVISPPVASFHLS